MGARSGGYRELGFAAVEGGRLMAALRGPPLPAADVGRQPSTEQTVLLLAKLANIEEETKAAAVSGLERR